MKLIINYDLMRRIEQAKQNFGISTVLKNNFKKVSPFFGLYTTINLASGQPIDKALANATFTTTLLITLWSTIDIFKYSVLGDVDKMRAINDLILLSNKLGNANISTSFDLLLESEEYKTIHKLKINEGKLPSILQEKYILVPTYNNGQIKETSLLQEHVIGSREYVLSLGSPTRAFKPVFAGI